jgi:hypothetical protein
LKKLPIEALKRLQGTVAAAENEFSYWRPHFQEIAKFLLPRRYVWLAEQSPLKGDLQANGNRASKERNNRILDPTGTTALRDMSAGLLNGITSPARPWLRLRVSGFEYEEQEREIKAYMDECARRMLMVLAESNFYNSMAVLYLDLGCFGTASMLVYEDFDDVVRFYNSPMGEYRLAQDHRRMVDTFSRTFVMTLRQAVQRFGAENLAPKHQPKIKEGGQSMAEPIVICHLIEPNTEGGAEFLRGGFEYREFYWEKGCSTGQLLAHNGFYEKPHACPRWEVTANDVYGTSPAMDALPDIIQLQQETLRKAQSLDYLVRPPVALEGFMANRPTSLLPGGRTAVPSGASFGAKPIYTVQPPLDAMTLDIREIQARIQKLFYNDLFRMISSLDTVRTATEIDARKEEKLVLLGAVLERFENEALDPVIRRVFRIMQRKELFPEPPEGLDEAQIEVEYVSILTDAQKAVGTATIERFLQVYANILPLAPETKATVNMDEVLRDYGDRLNTPANYFNTREEAAETLAAENDLAATREAALVGNELTQAAQNLSNTDVGGGANAMQRLLGG